MTSANTNPLVLDVWPGTVPDDDAATIGPERFRTPEESPTKDAQWLTNVTKPTISVFHAPKDNHTGMAILIYPGGGYWNLAWDLEGTEPAAWLNSIGITGIVLKYRCPRRPDTPKVIPAPGPLLDAQRAIRLVRSNAEAWHINANLIGSVGFSAGGHLAVATAANFDRRLYTKVDGIDEISCRPDFAIGVYSGYMAEHGSCLVHVPANTPPVLLIHANDDSVSDPECSALTYVALKRAGVQTELHIYAHGEHGFGVRQTAEPVSTWTARCEEWLRRQFSI